MVKGWRDEEECAGKLQKVATPLRVTTLWSRSTLPMVPAEIWLVLSAGQEAEWILFGFEGGCERFDLTFGDRIGVDDLEGHSRCQEDTHDT